MNSRARCRQAKAVTRSTGPARSMKRLRFGAFPIAEAKLRSRLGYQHAFAHNSGVTEWDPDGAAATDVLRLLAEISDQLLLPGAEAERRAAA